MRLTYIDYEIFTFSYQMSNHKYFLSGALEILCQSDRIYSKGLNNESNT